MGLRAHKVRLKLNEELNSAFRALRTVEIWTRSEGPLSIVGAPFR